MDDYPGWRHVSPREVSCPTCDALPGSCCFTLQEGNPTPEIHAARRAVALAAAWAEVPGEAGELMRRQAQERLERARPRA